MSGSEWVSETAPMLRPVTRPPATIHGVRLPNRERVRSEKVPKTMLASSATTDPKMLTRPSMDSLLAGSMDSNTRGRMMELRATHGMAQATAEMVKPMPRRMTSVLVGR